MTSTITMSNYIFNTDTSVYSKLVYAAIKKFCNNKGVCFPSRNTLAQLCNISLSTLRKAINSLEDAKVLDKTYRYRENNSQTSNLYSLASFMTSVDYYFKVRGDIFELDLSEKEIIVYMYLCSCANKENICFPSLKQMAAACSISQTSVKKAIKELIEKEFILKINQFREDGGKRNNLYFIVTEDNNLIDENTSTAHELEEEVDVLEIIEEEKEIENKNEDFSYDNSINETETVVEVEDVRNEHVFNTDSPNKKVTVNIRDDIFEFKLSKHSMLVYLYVCTCSELKMDKFPPYEQIANVCKISVSKVANAILELKIAGLITILKQKKCRGYHSQYRTSAMGNIKPPPWSQ